jgi:hypothetical protein
MRSYKVYFDMYNEEDCLIRSSKNGETAALCVAGELIRNKMAGFMDYTLHELADELTVDEVLTLSKDQCLKIAESESIWRNGVLFERVLGYHIGTPKAMMIQDFDERFSDKDADLFKRKSFDLRSIIDDEHYRELEGYVFSLSPENLYQDGELNQDEANEKEEFIMKQWSELETKIGFEISLDEAETMVYSEYS